MRITYFHPNEILPLFVLPNTILFPDVTLPFHIFENRYRALVTDSLDKKGVFCLGTISDPWTGINEGDYNFYSTGTICRIVKYTPLENGKYNILVKGVARCKMLDCEYRQQKPYRTVRVETPQAELVTHLDKSLTNELRQVAVNFFKSLPTSSTKTEIDEHFAKMESMQILNILCLNSPVSMAEKHALFEKETITEICDTLFEYFESFRI